MSVFEYTALDVRGKTRKGTLEGDTPREVRTRLRQQELTPLTVDVVRQRSKGKSRPLFSSHRVGTGDLTLATRQLATLSRAGLPVEEALHTVSRQTDRKGLRSVLLAVRARVLEGHSLANALGSFPAVFSNLFRETVAAGERSGQLDQVLERLADYLENSRKLQQKVGLAMIYPAIVMTFALLVTVALLTYVVPEVTRVFADFDQELPWLTRALIAVSDFFRHQAWLLLIMVVAGGSGIRLLMQRLWFRARFHRLLLSLPLISRLTRGLNTARFARTFGILAGSGVPALEGLRISSRLVENLPMRWAVELAADKVREGAGIHTSLAESGLFSPLVLSLIASGEAGGELSAMLDRAAAAQEQEVETLVTALAALFEPLLILLMGGMVLTIVMAILLPVFDLNQLIQ